MIDDAAIGFSGRADREDSSFGKTYRTMAGKLDRITGKAGLSIYASEIMKFNIPAARSFLSPTCTPTKRLF